MSLDSFEMSDLSTVLIDGVDRLDWERIISYLAVASKIIKRDRCRVTIEILGEIANVLQAATSKLDDETDINVVNCITECFRFLRNTCAVSNEVQKDLGAVPLFNCTSQVLKLLCDISDKDNSVRTCIKIIVQFFGNAIVKNLNNQKVVWNLVHPHLRQLLSSNDSSLMNCTCMVLYNILLGEMEMALYYATANMSLLLKCYSEGSEFAMFAMEFVLRKEGVLEEVYLKLEFEDRIKMLNAIWSFLVRDEKQGDSDTNIPLTAMLFLVDQFKLRADCVLKIVEEEMTAEPRETLLLLDVVACASSRTLYLTAFQADQSFLISVAYLLKNVVEIGKSESSNVFSCVQRLSEMKLGNTNVQEHPVFGFKASLVRLLGNLCHRAVDNQNKVRELGCIPAVLDTCNIDVYNPLLLQWGILAVRNLLEDNAANQHLVAGLVAHGPAPATVLQELGMELHSDENGSLCIAPLKRS